LIECEEQRYAVGTRLEIDSGGDLVLVFERDVVFSQTGNRLALFVSNANGEEKEFGVDAEDFVFIDGLLRNGRCCLVAEEEKGYQTRKDNA
jgi:hypothetical protein